MNSSVELTHECGQKGDRDEDETRFGLISSLAQCLFQITDSALAIVMQRLET